MLNTIKEIIEAWGKVETGACGTECYLLSANDFEIICKRFQPRIRKCDRVQEKQEIWRLLGGGVACAEIQNSLRQGELIRFHHS